MYEEVEGGDAHINYGRLGNVVQTSDEQYSTPWERLLPKEQT